MGNKKSNGRSSARRAAAFMAALGMLVLSSGVALMVTSTSASATPKHNPVNICHATSSDTNPYVFITVDSDSKQYEGHLAHHTTPNKTWNQDTMWGGVLHAAGSAKPDLIDGIDGATISSKADCNAEGEPQDLVAEASVTFVDPSCANDNVASYSTDGSNVTFDNPTAAPGTSVTVTATADDGASFSDNSDQKTFSHDFPAAATDCSSVSPPVVCPQGSDNAGQEIPAGQTAEEFCNVTTSVSPPKHHTTKTKSATVAVTPTVVHAGLASVTADDLRSEQGLALIVAGMVMLLGAGGLGLRSRGAVSRI